MKQLIAIRDSFDGQVIYLILVKENETINELEIQKRINELQCREEDFDYNSLLEELKRYSDKIENVIDFYMGNDIATIWY